MADTYSDQLRIRLQEDGANSSTWGTITNTNFELFESSISGLATISTTGGTYALSETNGADDESRHAMLKVTGVLVSNSTIVVPSKTKNYTVWNATTGAYTVTIKTAAGTGVFVPRDGAVAVFCDGTNVYSTNRAAVDSTFSIYDETDPTKAVGFQVSGVTTATTRTLTVPDASGTVMLTSAIGTTVQAYDADLTTWAGITPGTGVATALAVNVGTAGAPVVNGGALGTPSGGTVTNLTGTASININGTVGATTPASVAATTLSATGVTTVQAGTALLPAIIPSGDPNTGMWFPAADTVAVSTGGAERMRIDTSGVLSMGATVAQKMNWYLSGNTKYGVSVISGALAHYTPTGGNRHAWGVMSTTDGSTFGEVANIDNSGNFAVISATGSLGYGTGAGGTVTQATSRVTGVTLNKPTGAITLFTAAGSATAATFTVTNTLVAATDTVVLSVKSGTNVYLTAVTAVAASSFNITFWTTGGTASDAPVINFAIIKGATS
jgi:hypothetical protein